MSSLAKQESKKKIWKLYRHNFVKAPSLSFIR